MAHRPYIFTYLKGDVGDLTMEGETLTTCCIPATGLVTGACVPATGLVTGETLLVVLTKDW